MMKHVNKVLVGKQTAATTVNAMNVGEIAVFDKNGKIVPSDSNAVKGEPFMFGVVTGTMQVTMPNGTVTNVPKISYSNIINPIKVTNPIKLVPYKAPVEETFTVALAGMFITTGYRYALRVYYKDMYELKSQFTHTYDTIAVAGDTATTIATRLTAAINRHRGRRVTAAVTGSTITLTARPKTDNDGKNSLNNYSQVGMSVALYATDPSALSSLPQASGAVITKTVKADPGDGNPKVIRDRENEALSYKGVLNRTAFPVIKPELLVDLGKCYDTLVIEHDDLYRSNDNQYLKDTPLVEEIYFDNSVSASDTLDIVKAFLGL